MTMKWLVVGEKDHEIFLFDAAEAANLSCVSCDPRRSSADRRAQAVAKIRGSEGRLVDEQLYHTPTYLPRVLVR